MWSEGRAARGLGPRQVTLMRGMEGHHDMMEGQFFVLSRLQGVGCRASLDTCFSKQCFLEGCLALEEIFPTFSIRSFQTKVSVLPEQEPHLTLLSHRQYLSLSLTPSAGRWLPDEPSSYHWAAPGK